MTAATQNRSEIPPTLAYSAKDVMLHLACEDHTAELPGEIWVERDGSVCWKTSEVVMTNGTKWLMSLQHTEIDVLAYLKLRATVEDNGVFTSVYAYILQPRPTIYPDKPSTIAVVGQMAHAKISYAPIPETTAGLGIAYQAVGMKGFNTVSIESQIGRIVQAGPAEVENYDTLQGLVAIYSPSDAVASGEWLKKCDDLSQRIFDMLSLAQGRLIEWSIRQLGQEERVLETEFNGPKRSGPPVWPVFHHLHLGPVLDLAVNHYTADLCEKTGFPIALEWFVHHPRYTELKLTSVVTALEHLLSAKDPVTKKAVINDPKLVPEALFKVLRKEMEQILTDEAQKNPIDKQEPFENLKRKLGHLNSGTLREKIDGYVCHYKVPLTGIRLEDIHSAIGARNDVVHRGKYKPSNTDVKLHRHVAVLREVVVRTFLSLLKFEGNYYSYLTGPKWTHFPPKAPEAETCVSSAKNI